MAFWSPMSHFVTFGTMGITCQAVCSASWVLLGAVGTVLGGCRWCVTIAVVAGVGHSLFVLADSAHCFGAVGDLFPGVLDGKVVHSNVSQLIGGCLEWLGHKFPKELSLMAVCMDDTVMQFLLMMLIIDHFEVVHQCLDVSNKILGLSPSLATLSSSSPRHTWVLVSCVIPCWIWSRKAEAFTLVTFCSSLLPEGIHCACISRDWVPRDAKTYLRWSSLSSRMQLRRSQFFRVW